MPKDWSAKYYQENKKSLQKKARKRYESLLKEKSKKWQHGRERYKYLPEDERQGHVEFRKIYYKIKKEMLQYN